MTKKEIWEGIRAIIIIVVALVLACFVFNKCFGDPSDKKESQGKPNENTEVVTVSETPEESIDLDKIVILQSSDFTLPNGYFYNSLDENGKSLYTQILNSAKKAEYDTSVEGDCTLKNLDHAYSAVFDDHPEYFWVYGSCYSMPTYDTYGPSAKVLIRVYNFYGAASPEEQKAMQARVMDEVKRICYKAQKMSTDYEKALYVHDFLVENTVLFAGKDDGESDTAYGCLVKHSANDDGLSAAYSLILKNLGIECAQQYGFVSVTLGGDPYAVDLEEDINGEKHSFCFVKSETISDWPKDLPVCSSIEYDYYVQNGWYMEGEFSTEKLNHILSLQKDEAVQYVKFDGDENFKLAKKALSGNTGKSISSVDSAHLLIFRIA